MSGNITVFLARELPVPGSLFICSHLYYESALYCLQTCSALLVWASTKKKGDTRLNLVHADAFILYLTESKQP